MRRTSKRDHQITTERQNGAFHTTHWTDVLTAQSNKGIRQSDALRRLVEGCWKPIYCYLRCKGYDREDALDLTQGFFHEVVLGRELVQRADRAKGRFRTFLLTALDRYLTDVYRAERAKQRLPEGGLIRFGAGEATNVPDPTHYTTPSEAFDYAWATALLDEVLTQVEFECNERGREIHWEVFEARVLQPITCCDELPSLAFLCNKYGISSAANVSKMTTSVKRRFQTVLRRRVRQFVATDAEVDDEIRHLMTIFSTGSGKCGK